MMRIAQSLALAVLLLPVQLLAASGIWECVDGNGNKRFTNIKSEAKGCRLLNFAPLNTVPGGRPQARPAEAPRDFPKVDGDTQRSRDADRRKILELELANEQRLLDQSRKELAEQESQRLGSERNYQRVLDRLEPYRNRVKLHEDNVATLKRELAGAK